MKLIFCLKCLDVYNAQYHLKTCTCGETAAFIIEGPQIIYSGKAICIGLDSNDLFNKFIEEYSHTIMSNSEDIEIKSWIIPFSAPHTTHVRNAQLAFEKYCYKSQPLTK